MTRPEIEHRSPRLLVNTLPIRPIRRLNIYIYIYIDLSLSVSYSLRSPVYLSLRTERCLMVNSSSSSSEDGIGPVGSEWAVSGQSDRCLALQATSDGENPSKNEPRKKTPINVTRNPGKQLRKGVWHVSIIFFLCLLVYHSVSQSLCLSLALSPYLICISLYFVPLSVSISSFLCPYIYSLRIYIFSLRKL